MDLSQDISKRLSLPADLHIPESFLAKQAASFAVVEAPLTRASRRQSLSEIGFGRSETYVKLDKLGEVLKDNYLCNSIIANWTFPVLLSCTLS